MVAIFSTGDLSSLEATVSAHYHDHQGLGGAPIHGPQGFATVVAAARSGCLSLDVIIEDLICGPDRAVARLRWRAHRPSGEIVERQTLEIVRIEDGKAIEHWGGRS